jgi:multimeric flavodoxin WrbA
VVTHDDLRWAHGIAWGTPTRYGNMSAQMKQFVDSTAVRAKDSDDEAASPRRRSHALLSAS